MDKITPKKASEAVKSLVLYANCNLYLDDFDMSYCQNQLLDALKLTDVTDKTDVVASTDVYATLSLLSEFACQNGLIEPYQKLNFETKLIGLVMPLPSQVLENFDTIACDDVALATDMLFRFMENSTYIRRPDINKNLIWDYDGDNGKIVVTVNLSKPEKTAEEVRLAKLQKTGYPKCVLCYENVGFAGNASFVARQNNRVIPFTLNNDSWFLQFSPYQYFDQHVVVVSKDHHEMRVNSDTVLRMADFVDIFPHYFIGSNAALPIVGGSILAHDHYQGGKKVLPVFDRDTTKDFYSTKYPDVKIGILNWYNSIIEFKSKNRQQLVSVAKNFIDQWLVYSNKDIEILHETVTNDTVEPHNALNPIMLKDGDTYRLLFILRNNRTDSARPDGIFHAPKHCHNIKQESIGLIEAMGLFILPGRLLSEAYSIKDILTGETKLDFKTLSDPQCALNKHFDMIAQLSATHGTSMNDEKANEVVTDYINRCCQEILETTAVFKGDKMGQDAFEAFVESVIENMN